MHENERLGAYLDGMQFALLAIEGRVHQMKIVDRETVLAVLEEYHVMAMHHRARNAPPSASIAPGASL